MREEKKRVESAGRFRDELHLCMRLICDISIAECVLLSRELVTRGGGTLQMKTFFKQKLLLMARC